MTQSAWWSAHTHSSYSPLDGISRVADMVAKAAKDGRPALGLTDHGLMGGTVQLYEACKKHDILPFPGVEAYLLDPAANLDDKKAGRYHLGLLATSLRGYQGLVKAVSLSHTRPRFNRFPRLMLEDLADLGDEYGDDIILTTGCYFGLVQQTLVTQGPRDAERMVKMYAQWFPHTIVELQHHSICHDQDGEPNPYDDDRIVSELFSIANRLGLPVMATQDSHYLDQKDKLAHSMMKRLVYGGADDAFPGDSFHVASQEWVADHYPTKVWDQVELGAQHMLDLHTLTMPALDKFTAHVPNIVKRPQTTITKLCRTQLDLYLRNIPKKKHREYNDRLVEELSVISDLGMAGYFVIVKNYVTWCQQNSVCIEARGSANASLVCFLLGITQADPVEWNLLFGRFLSRDRTKPPDIDMDVEDVTRDALVEYLQSSFDTMRIGTFSKLGTNDEGMGSVVVTYKAGLARDAQDEQEKKAIYARIHTLDDVRTYRPDDYPALKRLSEMPGVYKSYGVHAGGILLSGDTQKITDYVPHMLVASSNSHVSQFDMDDVEKLGYLKLDILGQTTLTVMRLCQQLMGRDDPTDFAWIPNDDPIACKAMREGRVDTGIFHVEGFTKSKGGKELGIKTTSDAILMQGLYMPGAMDTGQKDLYVQRRRDPAERKAVTYIHPVFEEALGWTYGTVIFQEQVINIMRGLGMSIAGINTFFKIVKTSGAGAVEANQERLAEMRAEFDSLCIAAGISEDQLDEAWHLTSGFVAYGFNLCTTGDTVLVRSSGNQYQPREITIADLYKVWYGPRNTPARQKYRRQGVKVLAHKNGRIKEDRVIDVHYQGLQDVWKVTLANGMSIRATANHRHLTKTGWKQVRELTSDDLLATMGEREIFSGDHRTGNPPNIKNGLHLLRRELKAIGKCAWCGSTTGQLEIAHLDSNPKNNTRGNLRLLCNSCHKQHDWDTGQRKPRHSRGRSVVYSPITSIVYDGVEETYDVEMEGDDHSWVGNGIVTHNSHATGYGIRSYRTAYLKTHYPLEYMTALLTAWAGKTSPKKGQPSKETLYQREARRIGIKIVSPDVNKSGATWTMDRSRNAIRRGIVSIKGVGVATAHEIADNAPYDSIEDLIERTDSRKVTGSKSWAKDGTLNGILEALRQAGALQSLGIDGDDY
jgi:DNA polymerase-3 subunit alpha